MTGPFSGQSGFFGKLTSYLSAAIALFILMALCILIAMPVHAQSAPNPPTSPNATAVTPFTATLNWTPPTGPAAVSYRPFIFLNADCTAPFFNSGFTFGTSLSQSSLTPSTQYSFNVTATNANGTSTASTCASFTTGASTATVPSAPPPLVVSNITDNSFNYTFSVSANDGGEVITQYDYSLFPNGNCAVNTSFTGGVVSPVSAGTPLSGPSDLVPGTIYSVNVRARNVVGLSPRSSCVSFTTTGVTPPPLSAPQNLQATAISGQSANLNWDAPAQDGGSPVNRHELRLYTNNDCQTGLIGNNFVSAPTTSQIRNGLTAGTTYYYQVQAFTIYGGSPKSVCESFMTTASAPTVPQNITGTGLNTSIRAAWAAPASDGGSPVTGYQLAFYDGPACAGPVISNNGVTGLGFTLGGRTSATQYSFTVRAENAAGNSDPSACTAVTTTNDTTRPTVTISPSSGTVTGPFTLTFTFSEDVTGFELSDLLLQHGTATNFSGSGSVYTVLITPSGAPLVAIDVGDFAAEDLNGNVSIRPAQARLDVDTTAPTVVSITRNFLFEKTNLDQLSWVVTFSEPVLHLDPADFAVTGSTATVFNVGPGGGVNAFVVTAEGGDVADLNGVVSLSLIPGGGKKDKRGGAAPFMAAAGIAGDVTDVAGNPLANPTPTGANESFIVDNTDPTVSITNVPGTVSGAFTATFAFSEGVFDFTETDIVLTNATASNVQGGEGSASYTATITPTDAGAVTIDVPAAAVRDIGLFNPGNPFGNPNTAATQASTTFDAVSPTIVSIVRGAAGSPTNADTHSWVATFSEPIVGANNSGFVVTGTTAAVSVVQQTETTVLISISGGNLPTLTGTATVNLNSVNDIADLAGRAITNPIPTGIDEREIIFDNTPPTVIISGVPATGGATFTATFTFAEPVTGFEVGDITVTNGSASDLAGSGATYTATITAAGGGNLTVAVLADVANDLAGNANTASGVETATIDAVHPTVAIVTPANHIGTGSFDATITFSETVTGFVAGDVTVGGGATLTSLTGSGAVYTATISPPAVDAAITIDVAANVAQDAVLNGNMAAAQATTVYVADNVRPAVVISGAPESVSGPTTFNVTITFSEPVVNFVAADVTATGASVTSLTGSGATYTAAISTTGVGDTVITVGENVAEDAAGNGNTASTAVTITNTLVQDTQRMISGFLTNRMNNILQNQPELISFVGGQGSRGNFAANGDTAQGRIQLASSVLRPLGIGKGKDGKRKFDIWTAIYGGWSDFNTLRNSATVAYLGAHYLKSDNMIIGGLLQVDWTKERNSANNSRIEGTGWMVGPYIAGKFKGSNVTYEARAAWGKSDNKVSPLGTFTDSFDTSRWLARAKIRGNISAGKWDIVPNVAFSYFSENQEAYTDTPGNLIPGQRVSLGELNFGPELARTFEASNGNLLQPKIGISGVWNFDVNQGATTGNNFTLGTGSFRAKINAGLNLRAGRWRLGAEGHYDGIGISNYNAYGISLTAGLRF